jgi:hypothetical protein
LGFLGLVSLDGPRFLGKFVCPHLVKAGGAGILKQKLKERYLMCIPLYFIDPKFFFSFFFELIFFQFYFLILN